ncbi:MAG: TlpA family protein disulfide reductase [Bacteroides sp.]|nr:TlpA family protein disulfide reductase [Bacteroides sp.]MBD5347245.1 TlpA family protein disulfide reductase [Bacteroides sp.]
MKLVKALINAAVIGISAASATAQNPGTLTIKFPARTDSIIVAPVPLSDYFGPSGRSALRDLMDTVVVTGTESYTLALDPDEALSVMVSPVGERPSIVYAAPGETLTLDLTTPLPVMSGSPLVEGISAWNVLTDSILDSFRALPPTATDEQRRAMSRAISDDLNSRALALVKANSDNALGVYMIQNIRDENGILEAFELLGPGAQNSILAPMYSSIDNLVGQLKARKAAAEFIQVGNPAPDFTLPDAQGKQVSLSDFKGKWVMLDFWGTWCGWCIKGIPQMKEQWSELSKRDVVFVSVACNDSKEAWLGALQKYELPWVNVWSNPDTPSAQAVQNIYAVQGYPTKLVIDPQGKIALIVVGEDPTFYDQLRSLL